MSHSSDNERSPKSSALSIMKGVAKKQKALESAFDKVLGLYDDEGTLDEALTEARAKVLELEALRAKETESIASLQARFYEAVTALKALDQKITIETSRTIRDGAALRHDTNDEGLVEAVAATKKMMENSAVCVYHRNNALAVDPVLNGAKRYVKMLEGAKLVADAGGMKRTMIEDSGAERKGEEKRAKLTAFKLEDEAE